MPAGRVPDGSSSHKRPKIGRRVGSVRLLNPEVGIWRHLRPMVHRHTSQQRYRRDRCNAELWRIDPMPVGGGMHTHVDHSPCGYHTSADGDHINQPRPNPQRRSHFAQLVELQCHQLRQLGQLGRPPGAVRCRHDPGLDQQPGLHADLHGAGRQHQE